MKCRISARTLSVTGASESALGLAMKYSAPYRKCVLLSVT